MNGERLSVQTEVVQTLHYFEIKNNEYILGLLTFTSFSSKVQTMTAEELQVKKFELDQKILLEELELKKKDLELKIQEQKSKRVFTPLVISIVGGLITVITGLVLGYAESNATIKLEDKKFQSSLLLKATDAKTYDEFSNMLLALQENGLLSLDSAKIARFRKKRFLTEYAQSANVNGAGEVFLPNAASSSSQITSPIDTLKNINVNTKPQIPKDSTASLGPASIAKARWRIVAGADTNLKAARDEQNKSIKQGFKDVIICLRNNSYRTCIGSYENYSDAVNDLFEVKEKINGTSYIVNYSKWCTNWKKDERQNIIICN